MPAVNWQKFLDLAGAPDENFELLCRSLMRRHYARFGEFAGLVNQPGVEFHLKLAESCTLGAAGDWFGWQCRWYDIDKARPIGTRRRAKILESIRKTEEILPGITHWILWTRYPLTKSDDEWYRGLDSRMKLISWSHIEVEDHLAGEGELLRSSYFGELVLNPDSLRKIQAELVAPIRKKWNPDVHQTVDVERELNRVLMSPSSWRDISRFAERLGKDSQLLRAQCDGAPASTAEVASNLAEAADACGHTLANLLAAMLDGGLDAIEQYRDPSLGTVTLQEANLPRRLRNIRHPTALTASDLVVDVKKSRAVIDEVFRYRDISLVVLLADAGCGKTQLSAQLTAPSAERPAGIFLQGKNLAAGHTLDDLAKRITIGGAPCPSIEALLAAVDAAGQRSKRRLPICIDGLNESEDPREWSDLLAGLYEKLPEFPYVVVICTVRPSFEEDVLPPHCAKLEFDGFGEDAKSAVRRYFEYYKINPEDVVDVDLPAQLSHPLTLKLFCEATNSERLRTVGVEAMPASLTEVFIRYLEHVAKKISETSSRSHRFYDQDVAVALATIGSELWDRKARLIEFNELRRVLRDDNRPWNQSIVHALEDEGVLLRVPGAAGEPPGCAVSYDALAGHLISGALLGRFGRDSFKEWISTEGTQLLLVSRTPERHPLGEDIFKSLVALVPRGSYLGQLWQMLDGDIRQKALMESAWLEGRFISAETVSEIASLLGESKHSSLFWRLKETRGAEEHPLNAEFIGNVLAGWEVGERDLVWTEWVRFREYEIRQDIKRLESRWRKCDVSSEGDKLRARWVLWILTSTIRPLRDEATRALYWFGRLDPGTLFRYTLESLSINDQYVPERLLAASFGVVMAHQLEDSDFAEVLQPYLKGIHEALCTASATNPTSHYLQRLYVEGTFACSLRYHPAAYEAAVGIDVLPTFAAGETIEDIDSDDPRAAECDRVFGMDFENYTVGRLFSDRWNYQDGHPGHVAAISRIRGYVWDLGWRSDGLGLVDREIGSRGYRSDGKSTERYGKKYSWIGFYNVAGQLDDAGKLPEHRERLSNVDLDPSFPDPMPTIDLGLSDWSAAGPDGADEWIRSGVVDFPDEVFYRHEVGGLTGPWVAAHGYFTIGHFEDERRVFGLLTTMLTDQAVEAEVFSALSTKAHPGRHWVPEASSEHYIFAGEMSWRSLATNEDGEPVGDSPLRYRDALDPEGNLVVEILAREYAWESYHSVLNDAGGAIVPSFALSSARDLRNVPQSFDMVNSAGEIVSRSFDLAKPWDGRILYIREDVLREYRAGRDVVFFVWGERELRPDDDRDVPDWLREVYEKHADVWRRVVHGKDLLADG